MELHTLRLQKTVRRAKKRIGRGGKRGTYSGKGMKGQRARAGHRIRPAERDLFMHFPKLRGVGNESFRARARIVNVGDFERLFSGSPAITREVLLRKNIIRKLREPVKILSRGEVKKPYEIVGVPVSGKAREKIEKAGGKVQV